MRKKKTKTKLRFIFTFSFDLLNQIIKKLLFLRRKSVSEILK